MASIEANRVVPNSGWSRVIGDAARSLSVNAPAVLAASRTMTSPDNSRLAGRTSSSFAAPRLSRFGRQAGPRSRNPNSGGRMPRRSSPRGSANTRRRRLPKGTLLTLAL